MNTEASLPQPLLVLPIAGRDHRQGPIHAPATLVEYGDYECPYCGVAHAMVNAIQVQLGERLCFVFRHFPLASIHPFAAHAAEATEAAGEQGKFWEMHDALFENQSALQDDALARYAKSLGLDASRLMSQVMDGTYKARVQEDFRLGVRSGVNGTPTFFVNGVRHDGKLQTEALLEALLKHVPEEGE